MSGWGTRYGRSDRCNGRVAPRFWALFFFFFGGSVSLARVNPLSPAVAGFLSCCFSILDATSNAKREG